MNRPGVRRAWSAFRAFVADQRELQERLMLINRPWDAEQVHWAPDGALHGRYLPRGGGLHPVTRGGWCVCHRERVLVL